MRLKELLGLTLEELKELLAVEEARAEVRAELRREDVAPVASPRAARRGRRAHRPPAQLVRHRAAELAKLQEELTETRKRVRRKLRELDAQREGSFPRPSRCTEHPERRPAAACSRPRQTLQPLGSRRDERGGASAAEPRRRAGGCHRPLPDPRPRPRLPGPRRRGVNGYLARPVDEEARAGIVVIHEAGGLGDHIRDVVNRFANIGYVALGVDLYTREGGPPPRRRYGRAVRAAVRDARRARARRPRRRRRSAPRPRGLDRQSRLHRLLHGRALRAPVRDRAPAARRGRGLLGRLHRPRYAGGALDAAAPHSPARARSPALLPALRRDRRRRPQPLARARRPAQQRAPPAAAGRPKSEIYEGAGHAFFADYRPSYRPEPAARLWANVVPFLERHLRPS